MINNSEFKTGLSDASTLEGTHGAPEQNGTFRRSALRTATILATSFFFPLPNFARQGKGRENKSDPITEVTGLIKENLPQNWRISSDQSSDDTTKGIWKGYGGTHSLEFRHIQGKLDLIVQEGTSVLIRDSKEIFKGTSTGESVYVIDRMQNNMRWALSIVSSNKSGHFILDIAASQQETLPENKKPKDLSATTPIISSFLNRCHIARLDLFAVYSAFVKWALANSENDKKKGATSDVAKNLEKLAPWCLPTKFTKQSKLEQYTNRWNSCLFEATAKDKDPLDELKKVIGTAGWKLDTDSLISPEDSMGGIRGLFSNSNADLLFVDIFKLGTIKGKSYWYITASKDLESDKADRESTCKQLLSAAESFAASFKKLVGL